MRAVAKGLSLHRSSNTSKTPTLMPRLIMNGPSVRCPVRQRKIHDEIQQLHDQVFDAVLNLEKLIRKDVQAIPSGTIRALPALPIRPFQFPSQVNNSRDVSGSGGRARSEPLRTGPGRLFQNHGRLL
jgi:hypothetical protein